MSTQTQQLINLSLLLLLGYFFSNLYLQWYEIGFILFYTLLLDIFLFQSFHNFILSYSFSALATAIGVILMMVATQFWIYFFVITLALLQKKYLVFNKQHFFNPSNFAVIMALLFFYKDAHIVLGQLGDELWLGLVVSFLAITILIRVHRWIISFSFIFFYLTYQYIFIVSSDPMLLMEDIYYRFYSVSFLLFILFMLTDPRTTPLRGYQQIIFVLLIVSLTTFLDYLYGFRIQHMFLSLFLFSLFSPFFRQEKNIENKLLLHTCILFLLSLFIVVLIESKKPFYFTMS